MLQDEEVKKAIEQVKITWDRVPCVCREQTNAFALMNRVFLEKFEMRISFVRIHFFEFQKL